MRVCVNSTDMGGGSIACMRSLAYAWVVERVCLSVFRFPSRLQCCCTSSEWDAQHHVTGHSMHAKDHVVVYKPIMMAARIWCTGCKLSAYNGVRSQAKCSLKAEGCMHACAGVQPARQLPAPACRPWWLGGAANVESRSMHTRCSPIYAGATAGWRCR